MVKESYTFLQPFSEQDKLNTLTSYLRERKIDFQLLEIKNDNLVIELPQKTTKEIGIKVKQKDILRVSRIVSRIDSEYFAKKTKDLNLSWAVLYIIAIVVGLMTGFWAGYNP